MTRGLVHLYYEERLREVDSAWRREIIHSVVLSLRITVCALGIKGKALAAGCCRAGLCEERKVLPQSRFRH